MGEPYFKGLDSYAESTFDCEVEGCFYNQHGRCIYNIAPIKIHQSRSCYEELERDRIECEHDYDEGLML